MVVVQTEATMEKEMNWTTTSRVEKAWTFLSQIPVEASGALHLVSRKKGDLHRLGFFHRFS